ncbi:MULTISPECIES: HAMP domain-containing sensor histidine kinase [unclassified Acinetobacter]|uniref:sensor histidine kinase n=1 Tax=unclassified Acinetobacter TaxID=196816 RepID=UPI0029343065|nr:MULTISPECIES: HAMP domain-containing sensor histidine kinase [unclassified Acinetobacter]WOE30670.1 HAMP domain-containing sensor histidine kinase [Acinetobacter sp. SAAs470]WOE38862.1 HAMP domain-containing sensor histidine kinase [Acinetobacter sp. SAAs474]
MNRYHLGLGYASYRCLIAIVLLIIFMMIEIKIVYLYPTFYAITLIIYLAISSLQLLIYSLLQHDIALKQTNILLMIDVVIYSVLILTGHGSELHLHWLFIIVIFAASILLTARMAFIMTLMAVISLIYPHVIYHFFHFSLLNHFAQHLLLCVLFLCIYIFAQMIAKYFQSLEYCYMRQAFTLERLQGINHVVLEQSETGYLVLDEHQHIILINPASQLLLGIQVNLTTTPCALKSIHPELFKFLQRYTQKELTKMPFKSAISEYSTLITIQKLNMTNHILSLLVIQDIKTIHQHVQQLKLAALGQLAASIAHEIRNPLSAIIQANQLFLGSAAATQIQLNMMIKKQAERINRIIEDTLAMAKNKSTSPVHLALDHFFKHFMREDLFDIHDQIEVEIQSQLSLYFDEMQLRQVLINLIRNAVRHHHSQHELVKVKIYQQDRCIRIDIQNCGQPISGAHIKQLFQPFFSTEINGTGLGLYLSMRLCEANQAQLNYIPQPSGTCFRIECSTLNIT